MTARERLLLALDMPDLERAVGLARCVAPWVGGFKVGLELFAATGPESVARLLPLEKEVFLDLKLHDIPRTAHRAAAAAARLGVHYLSVHTLGGSEMLRAAVEGCAEAAAGAGVAVPCVLAVTVLTSLDAPALVELGLAGPPETAVLRLAELATRGGCRGFVCSVRELPALRQRYPAATLVVPGLRPASAIAGDDQRRTGTPALALAAGADRLVVGRPLTAADDPARAAEALVRALEEGTPRCG